jgi:hypothetical protein
MKEDIMNRIITHIKNRILKGHRKYAHLENMDWALIAARKIYATYDIKLKEDEKEI